MFQPWELCKGHSGRLAGCEGFLGEVAQLPWLRPQRFSLCTTVPASLISLPLISSSPDDVSFNFVLEKKRKTKIRLF